MLSGRVEYGQRWADLLRYFEHHGGRVQRRLEELAVDLGWPERAVSRHLARMEKLKVIAVTRTGEYGARYPNVYTLLMTADDWERDGARVVREDRHRRRVIERERKLRAEGKVPVAIGALPPPSRIARTMAQIEDAALDAMNQAEELEAVGELDVDAWLAGT